MDPRFLCLIHSSPSSPSSRSLSLPHFQGGVIILVLAGTFLYLKCRRNVRLSKANKRHTMVREKITETEVETVPA